MNSARIETTVKVPRMKIGARQTIETLMSEETLLLAKFLRSERKEWKPRMSELEARDHSGEHNVRV